MTNPDHPRAKTLTQALAAFRTVLLETAVDDLLSVRSGVSRDASRLHRLIAARAVCYTLAAVESEEDVTAALMAAGFLAEPAKPAADLVPGAWGMLPAEEGPAATAGPAPAAHTFTVQERETDTPPGHITFDVVRNDGKIVRRGMWPDYAEADCELLNRAYAEGWTRGRYSEERATRMEAVRRARLG